MNLPNGGPQALWERRRHELSLHLQLPCAQTPMRERLAPPLPHARCITCQRINVANDLLIKPHCFAKRPSGCTRLLAMCHRAGCSLDATKLCSAGCTIAHVGGRPRRNIARGQFAMLQWRCRWPPHTSPLRLAGMHGPSKAARPPALPLPKFVLACMRCNSPWRAVTSTS